MGSIREYVTWRGDLPFSMVAPCEVDQLILSHLVYLDFDEIVPPIGKGWIRMQDAFPLFLQKKRKPDHVCSSFVWDEIVPLFQQLSLCLRYRDCRLTAYESYVNFSEETQFAAMTVLLPGEEKYYILFRGTDDTLIGWKENFNMSYRDPVPAQTSACRYVETLCKTISEKDQLILNGHSKGGNLAVYAASSVSSGIRDRILEVWDFDSPGFAQDFLTSYGYRNIRSRIKRYVPESSVFGMMLIHDSEYQVIQSTEQGVMQHDGFSWEVNGNHFCVLKELSEGSRLLEKTMRMWLTSMNCERREHLINAVFQLLTAEHFSSMTEAKQSRGRILKAYLKSDAATRKTIREEMIPFFRIWREVHKKKQPLQKAQKSIAKETLVGNHTGKPAAT